MRKIDTTSWGDFRVGDMFDIKPTKAYKLTNAKLFDDGTTPVVVNSAYNNGIGGYSSLEATERGNMVTFSDTVDANTIFYHASDFIGYPHVQGLYPKEEYANSWTENRLKFFVSIFRKTALTKGFDYGNKFRRDIAVNLKIKLPITADNKPDWEYMEHYMQQNEDGAKTKISLLNNIVIKPRTKIETTTWKRFKIGELFPKILKPEVYHTYQVTTNDNGIPYIVRSKFDNGMKYRVINSNLKTSPAGVISFGAENSTFFYQEEEWCSGRDIYYIDTRSISPYACRFLITCLCKVATKYSYNHGLFPDLLKKDYVTLPVKSDMTPDWDYMEQYMETIERKTQTALSVLTI